MIGYAKILDKEQLKKFIEENQAENDSGSRIYRGGWYWNSWKDKKISQEIEKYFNYNVFESIYMQYKIKKFWDMVTHLEQDNQRLVCFYWNQTACVVGYGDFKFIMPSEFFTFEPLQDYSTLSLSELKMIGGTVPSAVDLPATLNNTSKDNLEKQQDALKEKEDTLKKAAKDIQDAKVGELAKIQQEIEKMQAKLRQKQELMMAELNKKMEAYNEQKEELERQMFMINSQIYSIRCYLGEVIDFKQVIKGENASTEEKLIIYQKIRYLDEEFGKYLGMYNIPITEEDTDTFITVLQNREDIRNLFIPNEKCISILKASRTGKVKGTSRLAVNILEDYDMYHGRQIAVLVRNGENIYLGWTDEEQISISDENVFYVPKADAYDTTESAEAYTTKSSAKDMLSRMFLLSIVQGLCDNSHLLSLPENTNIFKPNEYIVFSAAEGWITDNTYGTFESILAKSEQFSLTVGDYVFTSMNISSHSDRYNNNDRGIGYANRTHGACVKGLTALPINKILYDVDVEYTYEVYDTEVSGTYEKDVFYKATDKYIRTEKDTYCIDGEVWMTYSKDDTTETGLIKKENKKCDDVFYYKDSSNVQSIWRRHHCKKEENKYYVRKCIGAKILTKKPHYFISTKSRGWMSDQPYNVNMEIYTDECYKLAYLCPTWIRYVIKTGDVGRIHKCGTDFTYADLLRDLNGMLEYLNEIQQIEKEYLIAAGLEDWLNNTPDWDVVVTEWRIAHKKRRLTPTSAKTFAKYISTLK